MGFHSYQKNSIEKLKKINKEELVKIDKDKYQKEILKNNFSLAKKN